MRIPSPTLGLAVCLAAGLGLSASFASATTVAWDFSHPTGQLGTSETYDSVITPPTGEVVPITAYGYEQQTTTGGSSSFNRQHSYDPKSTDLYGKDSGTSESGLGISNDSDHEIDYTVTSEYRTKWGHRAKTIFQSFIQLDLTKAIEAFPNIADATITIGSLQNPDTAVLSYSNKLGRIGTQIEQVSYKHATDGVSTVSLNLSHFSLSDPYLTISSAGPSCCQSCSNFSSSVLLDSGELTYTSATPTPEPAAAGLLGFAAMGLLLMPRRRTK